MTHALPILGVAALLFLAATCMAIIRRMLNGGGVHRVLGITSIVFIGGVQAAVLLGALVRPAPVEGNVLLAILLVPWGIGVHFVLLLGLTSFAIRWLGRPGKGSVS